MDVILSALVVILMVGGAISAIAWGIAAALNKNQRTQRLLYAAAGVAAVFVGTLLGQFTA